MLVSVILPTYNRYASLAMTLDSLASQTLAVERFEVVIVDDGSTDETACADFHPWPFARVIRQPNSGGVQARHVGAAAACGDVLVFLDDDMTAAPGYLRALAHNHADGAKRLSRGVVDAWAPEHPTPFALTRQSESVEPPCAGASAAASPRVFASNNMSIRAADFRALEGWLDLAPFEAELRGGIWADLEFAVRAQRAGFALESVCGARIVHRDYAIVDLYTARRRAERVSELAPAALSVCPWLAEYLPMYRDMTPLQPTDNPRLVGRKLLRKLASRGAITGAMARLAAVIERVAPRSPALPHVYRWIIGGHHYRGYRAGLTRLAKGTDDRGVVGPFGST